MAVFDLPNKTVTLKIVYYGCALGGKTTNLATLHRLTDPGDEQEMVSIATNDDRTLFFDLLPVDLGQIGGLTVRIKLYTVPGQVHYELTRRQVLAAADGVVFVADSNPEVMKSNLWALENLRFNLKKTGLDPDRTPTVIQFNKRDLRNACALADLEAQLNKMGLASHEAVATIGTGVVETFATVLKQTIRHVYLKTGRTLVTEEHIVQGVDQALDHSRSRAPALERRSEPSFEHRFDMAAYREEQAEQGRDRQVVDQDSLLTESVHTNMLLAEKLEGLRRAQELGDRRGCMMEALSRLAPALADPSGDALPSGVLALMLQGAGRPHGSLLLVRTNERIMQEREVVPAGKDVLNSVVTEGLGSLAYSLAETRQVRVLEDLAMEVFFGSVPPICHDIAAVLVAPLACDGVALGALFVYARIAETPFDATEREYWATASTLIGLSLHWRALRRKVLEVQA